VPILIRDSSLRSAGDSEAIVSEDEQRFSARVRLWPAIYARIYRDLPSCADTFHE
jgi:hypothetical protein